MDELARALRLDPFEFRRRNVVAARRRVHDDVEMGSYGLTECLDLVEAALQRGNGAVPPDVLAGRVGHGAGDDPYDSAARASAEARIVQRRMRYELTVGTAEFGNGTATVHAQIAAAVLGTRPAIRIRQSDTALIGHDTGAFGSTGTVVAGQATRRGDGAAGPFAGPRRRAAER